MTIADSHRSVPGFQVGEQLYSSSKTLVCRAIQSLEGDRSRAVVLKFLQAEYPTSKQLLQFRNQYNIAKNLDIPGIVRPYSLEPYGNGCLLVMEDTDGVSLNHYICQQPCSVTEGLVFALQLADIVYDLHRNHVIHKDIKPANILIQPQTKQLKLIDFSLASLLPKETQGIQIPSQLEGTLAYIAPEQTGRMNRGIDYRADFYALGVTLFELLTGQLPFTANDPMEWIHCHIAQQPPLACDRNPEVPMAIAQVIRKLMAKNAEDRYQNPLGLKYDLQICLEQYQDRRTITPFELGMRDRSDRFLIPEKLYGRTQEIQCLLDAFERVAQGATELMLISGGSGAGKTALINEVHKPMVRQQGYFIQGKFDQFNRDIPFFAFVQAFRDLMRQLLGESDQQLQIWTNKILSILGANAQVIVEVIPELERIIGIQPPVVELSGTAAQNRFNLLFPKFIQAFSTVEHPLVIFLDDLQWADSASLNLMQILINHAQVQYLLLLGTYRDHEVSPAHSLMLTLNEVKQSGATVHAIALTPLNLTTVNELVADTLACCSQLTHSLAELVYLKSQGNPFFTTQFLKTLYQDGLLVFAKEVGYWQCDITKVRQATLTDNVLQLMTKQLQKLPEITQSILKLAACIGNQFDLNLVAIMAKKTKADAATALWPALQTGLILPLSEIYKFYTADKTSDQFIDIDETITYQFLHDRVQQAAYLLIPESNKLSTHFTIGQLLLKHCPRNVQEENIFAIVTQLNIGRSFITQASEQEQLVQLNLNAAQKAKASIAYREASQYIEIAIELLPDNSWKTQNHLTLRIYELAAEVAYLSASYERMDELAAIILSSTDHLIDNIRICEIRIMAAKAQNKLQESIQLGLQMLALLGVQFPKEITPVLIEEILAKTLKILKNCSVFSLLDLPAMSDPIKLATMRILAQICPSAYLCEPMLFPFLVCEQINLSVLAGNCGSSSYSYADYGSILCRNPKTIEKGVDFGKLALKLCDSFGSDIIKLRTYFAVHTFTSHWIESLKLHLSTYRQIYQICINIGDFAFASLYAQMYCSHAYYSGCELKALAGEMEIYLQALLHFKQVPSIHFHSIQYQTVLNLLGESDNPCYLNGDICSEINILSDIKKSNNHVSLYYFYFNKTILFCLFNEYEQALKNSELAEIHIASVAGRFFVPLFVFYKALINLKLYSSMNEMDKIIELEKISDNLKKLKEWANYGPMNHLHRVYLVEAELNRVLGHKAKAIENYDRSIVLAQENEYGQDEALSNELAAIFYLEWGKDKVAKIYMQEAYSLYKIWGSAAKLKDLEKNYPKLLYPILLQQNTLDSVSVLTNFKSTNDNDNDIGSIRNNYDFDLSAVIKSAKTISSNLELGILVETLSQVILTSSGAEIFALILPVNKSQDLWRIYDSRKVGKGFEKPTPTLLASQDLPHKVIYQVCNLQEAFVFDKNVENSILLDDYFLRYHPQSILCLPLLNQGQLQGVIYLENRYTADVFTLDRQIILQFLAVQTAITLSNALLYESVIQRTAAMEASLDGIALLEDNRFVYMNDSHAEMFGYRVEELMGQSWQCLYSEEQVKDFFRNAFPHVQKLGQWRGDATALRKDGSTFDEEVTLVLQNNGQLICICRDITEQKKVEINLREQEEQYRSIFETASDGLSIWELDTNQLVTANPMEYKLCGYTEAEYKQLMPTGIIHPDYLYLFDEGSKIVKDGQEFYGYCIFIHKDGTLIDIEVKGMLCFYNGKPHGLFITRDISDRKRAEAVVLQKTEELKQALEAIQAQEHQVRQQNERLEIANIELARASRLKDEFLATISHELRTPLNGILGMSEIILDEMLGPLTEKQRKSIMTIEKSGIHLTNLINEILDVTRIESGQLEVEKTQVAVEQLCFNSLGMITPMAAKKNIRLECNILPGVNFIQADEKRIQQVLNNLLTNAIKFTPEGGQVSLSVDVDTNKKQIQFSIKDTGIGIPEQELDRIFDRFVQVDGKLSRQAGGLGIGLAIAKRIVSLHQGSITVSSTVGQGSCFSANLPYSLDH